jgi:hypothetical protein
VEATNAEPGEAAGAAPVGVAAGAADEEPADMTVRMQSKRDGARVSRVLVQNGKGGASTTRRREERGEMERVDRASALSQPACKV